MFHKVSLLSGISVFDTLQSKILCYDEEKDGVVISEDVKYCYG